MAIYLTMFYKNILIWNHGLGQQPCRRGIKRFHHVTKIESGKSFPGVLLVPNGFREKNWKEVWNANAYPKLNAWTKLGGGGEGGGGGNHRWLHVDSCPEKWVILVHIIISYCQNCNKLSWLWINHCALKSRLDPFVTQPRLLVPFADEGYERRLAGLSWITHWYIAYHLSSKQLFVYVY